jgi:hypothetical protein
MLVRERPSANHDINNYFDMFYQNVPDLRTKSSEICDNVCSSYFKIICLTETWESNLVINQNSFPESYTVYQANGSFLHGGGAFIALDTVIRVKL